MARISEKCRTGIFEFKEENKLEIHLVGVPLVTRYICRFSVLGNEIKSNRSLKLLKQKDIVYVTFIIYI